jgi:hypothetical protein
MCVCVCVCVENIEKTIISLFSRRDVFVRRNEESKYIYIHTMFRYIIIERVLRTGNPPTCLTNCLPPILILSLSLSLSLK